MADANILLRADLLKQKGYRTFIPESLLYKKGFIRIRPEHSVTDIVNNMDEDQKEILIAARRTTNRRNDQESDIIDLSFRTIFVPRFIFIWSVRVFVTPSIPVPKRCTYCQHFGHVSQQCKASAPTCEHCAEKHTTISCNNPRPGSKCFNCSEDLARIKLLEKGWNNPRRFSREKTTQSPGRDHQMSPKGHNINQSTFAQDLLNSSEDEESPMSLQRINDANQEYSSRADLGLLRRGELKFNTHKEKESTQTQGEQRESSPPKENTLPPPKKIKQQLIKYIRWPKLIYSKKIEN